MKHVHNYERDPAGYRFDPGVRAALTGFTGDDDILFLEAATAVRSATRAVERLRSRGGLGSGALDVLLRLGVAPAGVGELAEALDVSSRNVTGLVDTLEREGLAERGPDPADRRAVRVRITAAGRDWIAAFRAPAKAGMAAVFRDFTPAEVAQFRDFALRLAASAAAVEARIR